MLNFQQAQILFFLVVSSLGSLAGKKLYCLRKVLRETSSSRILFIKGTISTVVQTSIQSTMSYKNDLLLFRPRIRGNVNLFMKRMAKTTNTLLS